MAGPGAGRAAGPAIAALAAVLTLLPAAHAALASCGSGNRVDHKDAECLSANWNNRGVLKKSPYHVRNMCPEYGRAVAKVDLKSAMDRTLQLDDGDWRDGSTIHRIRGISCCSDMGICNRSDVLTDEGCLARFLQVGSAAATCRNATASYSGESRSCTIAAECLYANPHHVVFPYMRTGIVIPYPDLDEVHNCYGQLRRGPCNATPPDGTALTVSDARVREARGATLDFSIALNQAYPETLTFAYRTGDGTARDGLDYRRTGGMVHIWSGQTRKTVSVRVLDDDVAEGPETVKLKVWMSGPWPVRVVNPTATGTIVNTDPMPGAWIARFGRTVADQVLDAVDARMRARRAPGAAARLAGRRLDLAPLFGAGGSAVSGEAPREPGIGLPRSEGGPAHRDMDLRTGPQGPGRAEAERLLLPGASFSMTAETGDGAFVSVWGRGAATRFAGRDGGLALDGEVATGMLGADWKRGRWTTGLLVTRSRGRGGYRGAGGGTTNATLTGLWPWLRLAPDERLSAWAVAGLGEGGLRLAPHAQDGARTGAIRTGLDLRMGAAGLRGVALDGGRNGLTLAVKADAMAVRTASEAVSGPGGTLAAAEAGVTRLRLGLEGSRPFRLGDGSTLTPGMEIALRHDGGDAETGFGADIGAGLAWSDPERGLAAEVRGRGLLAHEARGFRFAGLAGTLSWTPRDGGRGPRLRLTRTSGVTGRDAFDAPAGTGPVHDHGDRRLEARFGYGLPAFGGRFTSTPEIALGISAAGRDCVLGWRLALGGDTPDGSALELAVEARRRESASPRDGAAGHAVGVRLISLF